MVRVSIVLPVYNGENFLADTLDSIRQQTSGDFEVICIDDASTDDSVDILEDFCARDSRFRLLRLRVNEGSAVKCMKYALAECTGDYFFYCSQDDMLSPNCLERLLIRSLETDADAVLPDMALYYSNAESHATVGPPGGDYSALLSGKDAFILSLDWKIHGFSLRRMDLVKRLGYDELYMNSDEYVARLFYLNCNRVAFCNGMFYYRQDNEGALTKRFSINLFDYFGTDVRLLDLLKDSNVHPRHIRRYALGVSGSLQAKRRLLVTRGHELTPAQRVKAQRLMDAADSRLELLSFHNRLYLQIAQAIRSVDPLYAAAHWLKRTLVN